jgi:hypothetical protein
VGEVVNRLDPVPTRRAVAARLVASVGWYTDTTGIAEAVTTWTTAAADDGTWSLELPASSSYDDDGTWYLITEPGARHACRVPDGDGPFELHDIEITEPGAPSCCPPPAAGELGARRLDELADVSGADAASVGQVLVRQDSGLWQPATLDTGGGSVTGQVRLTATAAEDLSGHRIVTPRTNGAVKYASNSDLSLATAPLWLTLHAALAGAPVELCSFGPVTEGSWSWVPNPVYLGVDGQMQQTVPTGPGAVFIAQVGAATATTRLVIDRHPSILIT